MASTDLLGPSLQNIDGFDVADFEAAAAPAPAWETQWRDIGFEYDDAHHLVALSVDGDVLSLTVRERAEDRFATISLRVADGLVELVDIR